MYTLIVDGIISKLMPTIPVHIVDEYGQLLHDLKGICVAHCMDVNVGCGLL